MDSAKQQSSAGNGSSSGRWNPTPEQLCILKELYHARGIRSPTADQIHHISWKLSRYGKIEGKNVFYWFQNHKARQRQKERLSSISNSFSVTISEDMNGRSSLGGTSKSRKRNNAMFLKESCASDRSDPHDSRTLQLFPLHCENRTFEEENDDEEEKHEGRKEGNVCNEHIDVGLRLCLGRFD